MTKAKGKNVRPEIGSEETVNKMDTSKARKGIGANVTFDASHYQSLPEYQGMRFRWADFQDGSVDKLLDAGFQLVPRRASRVKRPEGLGSRNESEWVCKHVQSMNGSPMEVYLMVTTDENYEACITGPNADRNAEIQRAMGIGEVDGEAREAGGGLKSYAGKDMDIQSNVDHNPIR